MNSSEFSPYVYLAGEGKNSAAVMIYVDEIIVAVMN